MTDAKTRLIAAVEKMRSALSEFANDDNWFDIGEWRTSYGDANLVPAWRGPNERAPETLAREALPTEDISALVEQVVVEAMLLSSKIVNGVQITTDEKGVLHYKDIPEKDTRDVRARRRSRMLSRLAK